MDSTTLKKYDKLTLKQMAASKGLTNSGYNGRAMSRMRKQDFIDFIISRRGQVGLEEELLDFFEMLFLEDINHLHPMFSIGLVSSPPVRCSSPTSPGSTRFPEEVDESTPCLTIDTCEMAQNCKCCTNNLKIMDNLINVENKLSCVICGCNIRNIVFVPCNHLATCINCSKNPQIGANCPLCRKKFESTIRIFA
ncbi:putative IAP [Chloriridovirus anopheles1]|uniref:Putative IAP n=1 Tax=Chloriridovirus anopheles1 TaxID=1465751 RepID=W8QE94_9VIRU|nr:putative IAP [Anopheles minimus iridovirus]AHL67630.1 putative IAP [Anopheles minimus iridovirus]